MLLNPIPPLKNHSTFRFDTQAFFVGIFRLLYRNLISVPFTKQDVLRRKHLKFYELFIITLYRFFIYNEILD